MAGVADKQGGEEMEEIYIEPELQYIPQRKNPRRIQEIRELRDEIEELKEERVLLFTGLFMVAACLLLMTAGFCLVAC